MCGGGAVAPQVASPSPDESIGSASDSLNSEVEQTEGVYCWLLVAGSVCDATHQKDGPLYTRDEDHQDESVATSRFGFLATNTTASISTPKVHFPSMKGCSKIFLSSL